MLDTKIESALNQQINAELWSSYLYLSMSCDMDNKGFEGISSWFSIQSREEYLHAERLMKFIGNRNGKVTLMPIQEVKQEWNTPTEAFEDTLKHEKIVTGLVNNLVEMAMQAKDFATQNMMKWFVDEQVEEESNVHKILDKLKKINNDPVGLYSLDQQLGQRQLVVPPQAGPGQV